MEITFFGTGNAWGIPEIGCKCGICETRREECSKNEEEGKETRENKLRTSLFLESDVNVLVECGPDFRQQYEEFGNRKNIDFIFISHDHNDHSNGYDDLSPIRDHLSKGQIPVFATESVWESIEKRFNYLIGSTLEKVVIKPDQEERLTENLSVVAIEMIVVS